MLNEFLSPEGDLEKYFMTEYWLLDQYVGDRLFCWGDNQLYQLGTNNQTDQIAPNEPFHSSGVNRTNWKQVICGGYHNFALKTDNTLWTWGDNTFGQLGLGDATVRRFPVRLGSEFFWKQLACGLLHSAAIKSNGTIWTWGRNESGQLGLGNLADSTSNRSPNIIGSDINWRYVACGGSQTFAIKNDGTLWAWGKNNTGQLGLGNTTTTTSPTQVGTDTNWKLVSAGREHTIALKTDGSLWSWGRNKDSANPPIDGLLGLGSSGISDTISTPTQIGSDYNWKYISCGGYHSAAIKKDGSLWTWGRNDFGQLGLSDTNFRDVPTQVTQYSGFFELADGFGWKQVSCGDLHTLGLRLNASAWEWGRVTYTTSEQYVNIPTLIADKYNLKQISSGYQHNCAVSSGSNPLYYVT